MTLGAGAGNDVVPEDGSADSFDAGLVQQVARAAHERAWGELEAAWAKNGYALLARRPEVAHLVYSRIPDVVCARHPVLAFAKIHVRAGAVQKDSDEYFRLIHQLMSAARVHGADWRRCKDVDVMIMVVTYRLHAVRHLRRFAEGRELIAAVNAQLKGRLAAGRTITTARLMEYRLACALHFFYHGDWPEASRLLNEVIWEESCDSPSAQPHVAVYAHGYYALIHGLITGIRDSDRHLQAVREVTDTSVVSDSVLLPATTAERFAALDVLGRQRSEELAPSARVLEGAEAWIYALSAQCVHDLLYCDPSVALARIDTVVGLRHHGAGERGFMTSILARSRADALIAVGKLQQARELCERHASARLNVPYARLHLVAGRYEEAVRIAESTVTRASHSARERAELYAIAAAAAIASGDESRAEVRIANTLSLCAQAGTVLPVALLPGRHRSAFLVRSSDASSWDDVLDGQVLLDRLRDLPGVFPGDGLLVDLTRREREVLSSLAETSSMAELATLFTLSLSTVKKQVNAIYRKLRVHTRSEALTTATELGLLRLRPDLGVTGSQSWDEQSTVVAQSTRSANAIRTGPNRLPGGGSRY